MADVMHMIADPDLIRVWLEGWAIAQETPRPTEIPHGWHVDVGRPDQVERYVFPSAAGVADIAGTVAEPYIYIKVCAALERVAHLFPPRWELERRGLIMTRDMLPLPDCPLPAGYELSLTDTDSVIAATIHLGSEWAAQGRVALNGEVAVYDRIETHADHRRRGLGRALMRALHQAARDRGVRQDILCASMMGSALYRSLGWDIHAFYTSAVIPA
ncbi:MAG: GNAT family N-acetyltransferase [Asticcacaulis sp.]|nr:GNAT family N-acetyltransferase [Asticcacaulis sp.]